MLFFLTRQKKVLLRFLTKMLDLMLGFFDSIEDDWHFVKFYWGVLLEIIFIYHLRLSKDIFVINKNKPIKLQ